MTRFLVPAALLASLVALLFVCTTNWFAASLSWNVAAVLLWFRVIDLQSNTKQ